MKNKLILLSGFLLISLFITTQSFAAFNPSGGGTYRLMSSIGSSDTTIYLSSFKEPVSNILYSMTYLNSNIECGTIDPQTTKSEFISFTGITQNNDGTAALTGVLRGLGRSYPYTASTTLASSHAGQSVFILSDAPCLFQQYGALQNASAITGFWTVPDPVSPTGIANREYVDGKSFGGIGGATETATGTVQIATNAQIAAGTKNGSIGRLVVPSSAATSTYNIGTANNAVVTGSLNFIDPNFISTLATSTTVGQVYPLGFQRQVFTTTGTSTWAVPPGVTVVNAQVIGPGGTGGSVGSTIGGIDTTGAGAGAGGYANGNFSTVGTTSIQVYVGTTTQTTSFGTNCFFECATSGAAASTTSAGAGVGTGGYGGIGLKGDFNLQGGGGGGACTATTANTQCPSGSGGSSVFGGGANGLSLANGAPSNGQPGGNYGGGGGGCIVAGSSTCTGGIGAQGIIIITY